MPLSVPPELKKITPFIRRAEELDNDKSNPESRLVSYYCRQHAVHTGIPLATSDAGKGCLGEILGHLESEKIVMNSFTRDEAKFLCRKFADKIFDKADLEDRTGEAGKGTAKTFYAAASFLEILQQFYKDDDNSEEWEEEKKRAVYAKWKATDILKAIKEGRKPTPGGYGEEDEEKQAESEDAPQTGADESLPKVETVTDDDDDGGVDAPSDPEPSVRMPEMPPDDNENLEQGTEVQLGPPPSYPFPSAPKSTPSDAPSVTFSMPQAPKVEDKEPAIDPITPLMPPPPTVKPVPSAAKPEGNPIIKKTGLFGLKKKKLSKAEMEDAVELTRFALAALEEKDVDLAAERMRQALQTLGR